MRSSQSEFFSPAPLLAVAVLALNDHVLKPTFHNALTGKLSDFAGCFVLPLFVSAVLGLVVPALALRTRVVLGAVLTFALFVPIKLSEEAAASVARALEHVSLPLGLGHQHIVADPTDLFALSMVAVALVFALTRSLLPKRSHSHASLA